MKRAFVPRFDIVATLRSAVVLLYIFYCSVQVLPAQNKTYCNPVNIDYGYTPHPSFTDWGRHRATADPVIVNYKGDYYLFSTNQWGYWWSKDMSNWNFVSKRFFYAHGMILKMISVHLQWVL